VESKEQIVVGVNAFLVEDKIELEQLRVNPAIEQQQRAKLADLRTSRDNVKVNELLGQLETAAKGSDNLIPLFVTCVENDLTLGEICGVLRKVWGEYQPPVWG
jgi:methylmalonyl-CoA mutase N-terminal domain/subunit